MSAPSDDALEITTDAVEITHSQHTRGSMDAREGVANAVSSDEMESKYATGSPHETHETHDDLEDLPPSHSTTTPRRGKMKEPKTTLAGGSIFKKKKSQQTTQNRQDLMEMNSPFSRRQLSELENVGDSEAPITPLPHDQVDISGAVFNLLNYTIGAGVLALPYAFAQAGLGLGMFLVAIVYSANLLTDWFLLGATRASLGFSYEQLAEAAFGHRFAIGVKCFIIFDSFGTLSAYMLVIGDTLHKFFAHYYSDNLTAIDPRFLMFIVLILFLIPFCFVQNINSFAISSVISIIPLIYLIIYQFIYYSKHGTKAGESVRGAEQGIGFFNALPVVIFAFSSQQVFYPIWNEIRERGGGENHMARVIHYAGISSVITYLLSGLGGYLSFPQSASAMILDSYPISIELNVLLIITAVSIVLSYPVVVFPCRMNIDRLIFPTKELSYFRFVVINITVVIAAFGIAVAIPSFAAILGFFGAITSTSIAYLMPAAFYLRLNREPFHKNRMKWIAALLFISAAAGGIASFVVIARDFRPTYERKESNG